MLGPEMFVLTLKPHGELMCSDQKDSDKHTKSMCLAAKGHKRVGVS